MWRVEGDLIEVEAVLGVGGGHARVDAQHRLIGGPPHRLSHLWGCDLVLGRVCAGRVQITREAGVAANVTQYKTALEAELPGELVDEMRSDGHQGEVALDQLDRPVLQFGDLLKVVLVVDQAARKAHPMNL
jgi:hypothetical protein